MPTIEEIQSYLAQNPGLSDQQIAAAMNQYQVSPLQMAQAVNLPIDQIQARYDVANQQNIDQPILDRIAQIQAGGGTEFDIAREAKLAGLGASDLSRAIGLSEDEISRLSGGILDGSSIPSRPTFSGVAAAWNNTHLAKYGTPLNLATASKESVQNQIKQLQSETARQQSEWDRLYGDTPEGKIIKENPPPDWRQIYEPWSQTHVDRYGKIIDRPWTSDEAAINQKRELDQKYIQAVQDYNEKYGTNISPDPWALGTLSQPNEFYKKPEKDKWYENPLNLAALAAAVYFGAPYLAEAIGGAEVLGGAEALGALEGVAPGVGAEVFALGEAGVPIIESIPAIAGTAGAATVPSAFETAISTALGQTPELGAFGEVGTAGFGTALPSATELAASLEAAGFAPGTAANLAGLTSAGTGATNLLGGATAFNPVTSSGISTSDVARAVNNARKVLSSQNQPGQPDERDTTDLMSSGVSMLDPSAGKGALPGTLQATYLAPGSASQQQNILMQLRQMYPELRGVSDELIGSLMKRTPVAAAHGGHIPEFITGATGHYVQGRGDGQSDDIPAMLADGEYVFDADTVAALGNGSNKAGAKLLDQMRENIREHKRSAPTNKIPPKAKSPLEYLKG